LIKTKTLGGSDAVTATQLDGAADTVYLEPANQAELLDITMVNQAIQSSRQNGGIPKGSLSQIIAVTVSDSPTDILKPTGEEVYRINAITIKESSGSDATVSFGLSDGTSSMSLGQFQGQANTETNVYGPFMTDIASVGLIVTSGSYLVASRDNACALLVSYHVLQS
jgi:hypothetical protein